MLRGKRSIKAKWSQNESFREYNFSGFCIIRSGLTNCPEKQHLDTCKCRQTWADPLLTIWACKSIWICGCRQYVCASSVCFVLLYVAQIDVVWCGHRFAWKLAKFRFLVCIDATVKRCHFASRGLKVWKGWKALCVLDARLASLETLSAFTHSLSISLSLSLLPRGVVSPIPLVRFLTRKKKKKREDFFK